MIAHYIPWSGGPTYIYYNTRYYCTTKRFGADLGPLVAGEVALPPQVLGQEQPPEVLEDPLSASRGVRLRPGGGYIL